PAVGRERFAVGYHYTSRGYLHYLTDDSDHTVLWAATDVNAAGQVAAEYTRNGVVTSSTLSTSTGWLLARSSIAHGDNDNLIQSWQFEYDSFGNLRSRSHADALRPPSRETFGYDVLDRLKTAEVSGSESERFDYDANGNLTSKNGRRYIYDAGCLAGDRPAGPHAVCTVDFGTPFNYDRN